MSALSTVVRALNRWRREPSLSRSFAVLSLLLGTLFAVVNPPLGVNDEFRHWSRAFELSDGRMTARGPGYGFVQAHVVPAGYGEYIKRYEPLWYQPKQRVKLRVLAHDLASPASEQQRIHIKGGAGGYNFVPYVPAICGIWLARLLCLPFLWHLYLARLASVVFCSLLSALAVRQSGRFQWTLALVGLMPMVLTQIGGVSADGVTTALGLVFFALLAKGLQSRGELTRRDELQLLVIAVLMSLCKPIYVLNALAIPAMGLSGDAAARKRSGRLGLLALAFGAAAAICWATVNRSAQSIYVFSPETQIAWMKSHPFSLIAVAWRTVVYKGSGWVIQLVGVRDTMAGQARLIVIGAVVLYLVLLVIVSRGVLRSVHQSSVWRGLSVGVLVGTFVATGGAAALAMYLYFNPVGARSVSGIQGRYFHPEFPALLLAASFYGRPVLARWLLKDNGKRVLVAVVLLNLACASATVGRYYVSPKVEWPY